MDSPARPDHPPLPHPVDWTRRPSLRVDLLAAYGAAGARIGAWAVVSALVYRLAGAAHFGTLALIRGTIGILNYTAVGLAPAVIRLLATATRQRESQESGRSSDAAAMAPMGIDHASADSANSAGARASQEERAIYWTGVAVACASAIVGLLIAIGYAAKFDAWCVVPPALVRQAPWAVLLIGFGTLCRLFSEPSGALLQTRRAIALDNLLLGASEAFWALTTLLLFRRAGLLTASLTYAAAGVFLVLARAIAAARLRPSPWPPRLADVRAPIAIQLLSFGSLVLLSQLAEYFYAPTDYLLINHFFGPAEVSAYAPAVQIDLGLLMLVSAMATVLLPRAALAHSAGNIASVRKYYLRGTLASTLLLALAALGVWIFYPLIFRLWFGAHPPNTRIILDLVLAGTVIGGSSAVGRSVLLGMGKIRPFTVAAILAGLINVAASYCFVKYAGLGLRGILYGTLVAVVGRCGLWMPWYVLRTLGREQEREQNLPPFDPFARRDENSHTLPSGLQ